MKDADQPDSVPHWIRIRLNHPTMDPAEIGRHFSVQPVRTWRVGERRSTPKGQLLDGVYRSTYWVYSHKVLADVDEALIGAVEILESSEEFLKLFIDSGGEVVVDVSWGVDTRAGREINWEILQRLGRLRVSLGTEVLITLDDWRKGAGLA